MPIDYSEVTTYLSIEINELRTIETLAKAD
jgi:hypothetical protein